MAKLAPDNEVLEYAISREVEARNFYLSLAERVGNDRLSGILRVLADEELEHKAKLEMEFMKSGIVVDTSIKHNDFQISDYVVSDEPVIDMDLKDMLEICIQKEDRSFRLYVDLLQYAKDQNTKETLLAIIEEEIKHKLRFETEYDNLLDENKSK